ncbi:hypothetical protein [Paraliobacillus sp. PM-2]|uniref:hypothetical protein n=1 Tax=Paraliobacillus sp. PM-2 TaxID=1462524 RepID=UPI0011478B8E|nr:hypothetical protein [Paraliobacillus sp. PM-2]
MSSKAFASNADVLKELDIEVETSKIKSKQIIDSKYSLNNTLSESNNYQTKISAKVTHEALA